MDLDFELKFLCCSFAVVCAVMWLCAVCVRAHAHTTPPPPHLRSFERVHVTGAIISHPVQLHMWQKPHVANAGFQSRPFTAMKMLVMMCLRLFEVNLMEKNRMQES